MSPSASRQAQAGAALVVALILLVVMTLLGLSSVRTVSTGERMTANTFDRGLAFQATEAALRLGESVAQLQADAVPPNAGFDALGVHADVNSSCSASPCVNGLCSQPDKDCPERWRDSAFEGWKDAAGLGLTSLATTPQYIVEFLGGDFPCNVENPDTGAQDCNRYRVTARSRGAGSDRSLVILQSIYATD